MKGVCVANPGALPCCEKYRRITATRRSHGAIWRTKAHDVYWA